MRNFIVTVMFGGAAGYVGYRYGLKKGFDKGFDAGNALGKVAGKMELVADMIKKREEEEA